MPNVRNAVLCSILLAGGAARADAPVILGWGALASEPAPAMLEGLVPAGSVMITARGGEVLRLSARSRPRVGRLFQNGPAAAWVDESDLLGEDGAAWRYVVPIGAHTAVTVTAPAGAGIERARVKDVGYQWELYEDELSAGRLPDPPSAAGAGAHAGARAAAALLDASGAPPRAAHELEIAVALEAVALARPIEEPYYRADGPTLAPGVGRRAVTLSGPRYLVVVANGVGEARLRLDSRPVAGPAARVPAGAHRVELDSDVPAGLLSFKKRTHLVDALDGDESIEERADRAEAAGRGHPLIVAEAKRLRGEQNAAAHFEMALSGPRAARAYAAWRLGELAGSPAEAIRQFDRAGALVAGLPAGLRAAVGPGLARARALRAIADGQPRRAAALLTPHPALWSDPALAPALVPENDDGAGVARLAAAARVAPQAAAALRRVYFDRTAWRAAELAPPTVTVLAHGAGECFTGGEPVARVGDAPLAVDVPADPLGAGRFRATRVLVIAPSGRALDAVLVDGDRAIPVPTVRPSEEHRVALAPGRHLLRARGGAEIYVPASDRGRPTRCEAWRKRSFTGVGRSGLPLALAAPGGAVLGLELRLQGVSDPSPGAAGRASPGLESTGLVAAEIEIDGARRSLRYRAPVDRTAVVMGEETVLAESILVDFAARDPRTLKVRRTGRPAGTLLLRPLVRAASLATGRPARPPADLAARLAAAATALHGDEPEVAQLHRLGAALAAARDPAEQVRLRLARATVLARLGRGSYAEEDLRAAAELDASPAVAWLVADDSLRVAPVTGARAYPLDPTAPLLHDGRSVDLAARARDYDRAGLPGPAARAYARLADAAPDLPGLRAAEADRRLDAAEQDDGPKAAGTATRAFVAALLAGDAPGADDARARAGDLTRWRRVGHADRALGVIEPGELPPTAGDPAREVRAALAAPGFVDDVIWLEPGQILRATIPTRASVALAVEQRCTELRPHASAQRKTEPSCRLRVSVDGAVRKEPGRLSPGVHTVEVIHEAGGFDTLAGVRVLAGGAPVAARLDGRWWLAEANDPVVLSVLGPTALRLHSAASGAAGGQMVVRDGGTVLARAPLGGRTVIALPEERAYHLTIQPDLGTAAVVAEVREDLARPAPRLVAESAPDFAPAGQPSPAPVAPALSMRAVASGDRPGTLTLSGGVRDGALGERDTVTERGGRWGELTLTYRRRRGPVWWRADALTRTRLEGGPSAGLAGRAFWKVAGPLRLDSGVFGIGQALDSGTLATLWIDATVSARLPLGGDFFAVPSVGGWVRAGETGDPGDEVIDPDVWSRFDVDHPTAAFGQLRLSWEPVLDLHLYTRGRVTSNADLASIDRYSGRLGASTAIGRLRLDGGFELERRLADEDRMSPVTRPIVFAGAAWGLWSSGPNRLSLIGFGALRIDERNDVFVGLAYDWTFGRGLADYPPEESAFSGQLGPYGREENE